MKPISTKHASKFDFSKYYAGKNKLMSLDGIKRWKNPLNAARQVEQVHLFIAAVRNLFETSFGTEQDDDANPEAKSLANFNDRAPDI